MQTLINEWIATGIQIGLFALIPFLFFLFRKDKSVSFLRYIGLFRPTEKSVSYSLLASLIFLASGLGMLLMDGGIKELMLHPNTVTGMLHDMGLSLTSVLILLTIALFKTSLAEEIFFRGFLGTKLVEKFGFSSGNLFQSLIFGLLHVFLIAALIKTSWGTLVFVFMLSTFAGWVMGYIKIKFANGSIIPGWIAHGLGNALSYAIIAFVL